MIKLYTVKIEQGQSITLSYGLEGGLPLTNWQCELQIVRAVDDVAVIDELVTTVSGDGLQFIRVVTFTETQLFDIGEYLIVVRLFNNVTGEASPLNQPLIVSADNRV